MAFNGSGTFLINTAGQPVVPNTVISATAFNALTNDLANGLSTCITKDGQTTPTANIPMGSNKITGLAPGTSGTDAANLTQVQGSTAKLLQSVTGTDTITAAMVPALASYSAGQMFYFVAAGDNTGAVTINIDSLGAKSVTRDGSTALVAGDIVSGEVALIVYDGTRFQLLNGNSFTNLNVSNNLTLSGGTANGVLYLNGSKVATSGTALAFNGTTLSVTGNVSSSNAGNENYFLSDGSTRSSLQQSSNAFYYNVNDNSATSGSFIWRNTNAFSELMRLTSTGLGIGTASPGAKLESAGTSNGATLELLRLNNLGSGVNTQAQINFVAATNSYATITGGFGAATPQMTFNLPSTTLGDYVWQINNAEQMRLTSTGLGIGTASPGYRLHVERPSYGVTGYFFANDGTRNPRFVIYGSADGTTLQHTWSTGASNIIFASGGAIGSGTEIARFDASGNLGLGVTPSAWISGSASLDIRSTSAFADVGGSTTIANNSYRDSGGGWVYKTTNYASRLETDTGVFRWFTAPSGTAGNAISFTQALTLDASGNLGVGTTSPASRLHAAAAAADVIGWFDNSHASTPYGLYVDFSAASPDNNSQYFFRAEDSTAVRCYIWADGDLANHDGVYGTISDARLKQDIVDAGSQWDDLKAVRFRNYRMKSDVEANPDAPALFGVVAQELEQVCPGLVDEHTDKDGETTKTVKSSILLMKAAKALQEAMARIESLEAKVSALEAK